MENSRFGCEDLTLNYETLSYSTQIQINDDNSNYDL